MIFKKLFIFLLVVVLIFTVACTAKDNEQAIEEVIISDIYILNDIGEGDIILTTPGIYQADETGIFEGNIIIKGTGITIKNTEINGDITLHEDLGEGDAYFENVRVNGSTYVYGGGINSVHYRLVFMPYLYIKKPLGNVRIVVEKDTKIDEIVATSSSIIEVKDDSSSIVNLKVAMDDPEGEIKIKGNVNDVEVLSKCNINIEEQSNINKININQSASGTNVYGNGNIDTAVINAKDVNMSTKVNEIYSTNNTTEVTIDDKKVFFPNNTFDNNSDDDEWDNKKDEQPSNIGDKDDLTKENDESDDNSSNGNSDEDLTSEELKFVKATSIFSNSDKSFTLSVTLNKPAKVYYVYEDISIMLGSSYIPTNAQIKNGYNCFGQPNPMAFKEIDDGGGNMSAEYFPAEAMIAGLINVAEANKEYIVYIDQPTLKFDGDQKAELNSNVNLHIVAVDNDGNEIKISPTMLRE